MAVRVVSDKPVKTKKITCPNCGYELEFTGEDVKKRTYSCMGESDSELYITCPRSPCNEKITVTWPGKY